MVCRFVRFCLPAVLAFAFSFTASAAPITCATGNLADYAALGSDGCIVGDKLFNNFVFFGNSSGTGVTPVDTDVTVSPLVSPSNNPGLYFSSNAWAISGIGFVYSSISFTVTVLSPDFLIDGGSVNIDNVAAVLGGNAGISEQICPNFLPCQNFSASAAAPFNSLSITPSQSIEVVKEITVLGTTNDSFAALASFEERFNQVSAVPEPSTFALFGSALAAAAFLRRKR